jgi:hypothetical protein
VTDHACSWGGANVLNLGDQELGTVTQWDGQRWTRVGAVGPQGQVRALAIRGDELFVGGTFLEADGDRTIRQFARWRTGEWTSLGPAVGFEDGRFALTLQTDRGLTYGIEASDDLRTWTRLVSFTNLTEAVRFVDERSAPEPRNFCRAVSP